MRKLLYALTAGALLLASAGAAHADYNTVTGSVQAGGSVSAGSTQTFSAGGFKVGTAVTFVLHSDPITLGTVNADSTGTATGTFTIPSNAPPGTHTVSAQGLDPAGKPRVVNSGSFTIAGTSVLGSTLDKTSSKVAARTGMSHTVPLTAGGAILVLVGAGLATVARRRRSAGVIPA